MLVSLNLSCFLSMGFLIIEKCQDYPKPGQCFNNRINYLSAVNQYQRNGERGGIDSEC